MLPEQEKVTSLLVETVTLLCKNGVYFNKELKVQGTLGITVDENNAFVVQINQTYATEPVEGHETDSMLATHPPQQAPRKRKRPSPDDADMCSSLESDCPELQPQVQAQPAQNVHSHQIVVKSENVGEAVYVVVEQRNEGSALSEQFSRAPANLDTTDHTYQQAPFVISDVSGSAEAAVAMQQFPSVEGVSDFTEELGDGDSESETSPDAEPRAGPSIPPRPSRGNSSQKSPRKTPRQRAHRKGPAPSKYRSYSPTRLIEAYNAVKEGKLSMRKAAITYGVPASTLADRLASNQCPPNELSHSGPPPLLTREGELQLVEHLSSMASLGYRYKRMELRKIGSDYAVHLGKRQSTEPLTEKWLTRFLNTWPEIAPILQPPGSARAWLSQATDAERELELLRLVDNFFDEFAGILEKYGLSHRPELIYAIGEQQVPMQQEQAGGAEAEQNESSFTILSAANAIGKAVPPYFVFPCDRPRDFVQGTAANVTATTTVTDDGLTTVPVFLDYMKCHFEKFRSDSEQRESQRCAVVLDGSKNHVSVALMEWAKQHGVIVLILPADSAHILHPLQLTCLGPLLNAMNSQTDVGEATGSLCQTAYETYQSVMTPANIKTGFLKSGLWPVNRDIVPIPQPESDM